MRGSILLKALLLLVVCIVGIGFYRGWFVLSRQGGGAGDPKVEVNLTVDPEKAKEDVQALESKVREATD